MYLSYIISDYAVRYTIAVDLTYQGHKVAFKEMMRNAELISDFNKYCHPTTTARATATLTDIPESSNFSPTHCEFCSAEMAVHTYIHTNMHTCIHTYIHAPSFYDTYIICFSQSLGG